MIFDCEFKLQEVKDTGEFMGMAAVYGNVDLGMDVIEPGAFSKTIDENGGKVPLLLDHRTPIGISEVVDSPEGLKTRGILNMEKAIAREVHSDLKFYAQQGKPYGMSIGYDPIKKSWDGDVRHLKEIRLWETTVTMFPMNPEARVGMVKSQIDELSAAFEELKAGRTLSAATLQRMQEIMDGHQALIEKFRALMTQAMTPPKSQSRNEPEGFHSALAELKQQIIPLFQ